MAEEALEAADSGGALQDAVLRLVTAGVRPALAAALLAAPAAGADDIGAAPLPPDLPSSLPLPCTCCTMRRVTRGCSATTICSLRHDVAAPGPNAGGAGRWVVAAGLAAGHLMGLPPGSAGRRLLAQTLQDVHRCASSTLGCFPACMPETFAATCLCTFAVPKSGRS